MARQATATRRAAPPKAAAPPRARKSNRLRLDGLSSEQQVARLLEDREELVARVSDLERQVQRQTARQAEVADRLAWVLDSLRDVLVTKA